MNDQKNGIVIGHTIPLSREQRLRLAGGGRVETVGISVPVWIKGGGNEEPAVEIICRYALSSYRIGHNSVVAERDGYKINFGVGTRDLLDVPDGGLGEAWLNEVSVITCDSGKYTAVHQIHVIDESALEQSLAFMSLD